MQWTTIYKQSHETNIRDILYKSLVHCYSRRTITTIPGRENSKKISNLVTDLKSVKRACIRRSTVSIVSVFQK